jgi:hypothetical protein
MHSRYVNRVGGALLLVAAVLAVSVSGCSRASTSGGGIAPRSQLASGSTDASWSLVATDSAASKAGGGSQSSGGASKPVKKPLSQSDVQAIDAELTAIEKELDSMALPSDSDFGGIESGLE